MCAPIIPTYGVAVFHDKLKEGKVKIQEVVVKRGSPVLLGDTKIKVSKVKGNIVISNGYTNYYNLKKSNVFFSSKLPDFNQSRFQCKRIIYNQNINNVETVATVLDLAKIKDAVECIVNATNFSGAVIMRIKKGRNDEIIFIISPFT